MPMSSTISETSSATKASGTPAATILETRVVTGTGGGPEKTILSGPRFLDPYGYRTICAYMHPPEDPGFSVLQRRAESLGAALISIPDRGPLDRSVVRRLLEVCRREGVTIWHGHDYKSNLLGLWINRFFPMRLVSTVHGWGVRHWKAPLYDAIDLWSLRYYDRVICVSDDLRETCRRGGVPESRLTLLENGIDIDRFQRRRSRETARQEFGWPPESLVLGAIGRLSEEKGFDLLIEAVRRLRTTHPQVRLVIAGEGPCRQALQNQIEAHNLTDAVQLLGFCEDVVSVLEGLDLFVLCSRREGLPNVVLEAMAVEVPVIATRVAGVPRVLTDGLDGLLVEPEDVDALTAAIRRGLDDATFRSRLARAGRETVVRTRSFASRMARLREIYEELLQR